MRTLLLALLVLLVAPAALAACDPSCTDLGGGACRCPAFPGAQGAGADCDDTADSTPTCGWRGVGFPIVADLTVTDSTTLGYCEPRGNHGGGTGPEYTDATRCDTSCTLGSACGTMTPSPTLCGGSQCVPGNVGSVLRAWATPRPSYVLYKQGPASGAPYDFVVVSPPGTRMSFTEKHNGKYFVGQSAPGDLPTFRRLGNRDNSLGIQWRRVFDHLWRNHRFAVYTEIWGNTPNPGNTFSPYKSGGGCPAPANDNLFFSEITMVQGTDDQFHWDTYTHITAQRWIIGKGVDGWQEFYEIDGTPNACGGFNAADHIDHDCANTSDSPDASDNCCRSTIFTGPHSTNKTFNINPTCLNTNASVHHSLFTGARARVPATGFDLAGFPMYLDLLSNVFANNAEVLLTKNAAKIRWYGNYTSQVGYIGPRGAIGLFSGSGTEIHGLSWAYDGTSVSDALCGSLSSPLNGTAGCVKCRAGAACSWTNNSAPPSGTTWPTISWTPAATTWSELLVQRNVGAGARIGKHSAFEDLAIAEARYGHCDTEPWIGCDHDDDCAGDCYLDTHPPEIGCGANRRTSREHPSATDDEDGPCRPHSSTHEECDGNDSTNAAPACANNPDCPMDSKCVGPGAPFVCCKGASGHGGNYCGDGDDTIESPGGVEEHYPRCCDGVDFGWCDWPRLTQGTAWGGCDGDGNVEAGEDCDNDGILDTWEAGRSLSVMDDDTDCPFSGRATALARIGTIGDTATGPAREVNSDCNDNGYDDIEDAWNEAACDRGTYSGGTWTCPPLFAATASACGDGDVDVGETCDTGGESPTCDDDCTSVSCGDGNVNEASGEACDDGNGSNTDSCVGTCDLAVCGDGYVRSGVEECDDGDFDDTDACGNDCLLNTCGDGDVDAGETCDPGSGGNIPTCDFDCTAVACGDGVHNQPAGESCDDGNTSNGDGCSSTCLPEATCGNSIVESGEDCDDGGTANGDGCDSTCHWECGTGSSVLTNGSFASDTSGWFSFTDGTGALSWDAGEAKWTNTTAGSNVQVRQQNLSLTGNTAYRLTFKCRVSPAARKVRIGIIKHTTPFNHYVNEGFLFVTCGTSTGTHNLTVVTTPDNKTDARLMFLMGDEDQNGDVFYYDDVSLAPTNDCDLCGNGTQDEGEQCDDGNTSNGDGCSEDCLQEQGGTLIISELRRGDVAGGRP